MKSNDGYIYKTLKLQLSTRAGQKKLHKLITQGWEIVQQTDHIRMFGSGPSLFTLRKASR